MPTAKLSLTIGYLYGDLMNIYGDTGNVICLQKRGEWRGIKVRIKNISIGDPLKTGSIDLYFFGGGQDQAQKLVSKDLIQRTGKVINQDIERGVPLLSICGGYQLLGQYYKPHQGAKIPGLKVFPAYTIASNTRMIGNIIVQTSVLNTQISDSPKSESEVILTTDISLVGFENHSGKTYLQDGAQPLGTVQKGFGNNGEDQSEGCIYKNAIGCYLHGSLLPKNPKLADWFLKTALAVKYGQQIKLKPLADKFENQAWQAAILKSG